MRVNSTVILTLVLLTLMIAAGATSAVFGYRVGRGALKGITQPDARPINKLSESQRATRRQGLTFLKESDILAEVKARMENGGAAPAEGTTP